ncbi:NAD(P)H-hydrate dehydratase [Cognatiluteimonas weifangensis]|uniref:Bifunctional NAD(P)H-hydrate repair enzyme n=1 Tax=Cognatiluteimonas weifangensis TaxID=2303539 RepID=A0A372DJ15_9GAMM|nr:NAD(P)H-hydrate dehydratase [Luteimonas weifangensis]RFP59533.1 NAD(P)H-hydrate dehydratase [Luteimonas weifangensis]
MPQTVALYDTAALRALEQRAAQALGDDFLLMQRAGRAAWRCLLAHWPQAQRIAVVCGPGNNGGDGYVLATQALASGRQVQVLRLAGHAPRSALAQRAHADFERAGGQVAVFQGALPAADVVVDAVFGIGLTRAPDAECAALIAAINAGPAPVFALDVPSGVDADRGSVPGSAVRAARTLQFITPHRGLVTGAALDRIGVAEIAPLELDPALLRSVPVAAEAWPAGALGDWLPARPRDSHKGDYGHVLCIGGDHGSGGAIVLCAQAALRSGAGLVSVATRREHVTALLARQPEAMVHVVETAAALAPLLQRADVVAIGPGLGQGGWGRELLDAVLAAGKPLLLDADALNLLAAAPRALPADTILTPHPGEAARLLGSDSARVQADRYAAAQALAERHDCVVVLKGAGTLVAAPQRTPRAIAAGNPGMAVGGMGDLLSGVIAALRAQGLAAFDVAATGALLHAVAGDVAAAAGERGMLPSDLLPQLRRCANPHPQA